MTHHNNQDNSESISKTQKKKEAHNLQKLAREIIAMPTNQRNQLPLSQPLLKAIEEAHRISSHIARKRHFQYMGKLLLNSDHQAIIQTIQSIHQKQALYQVRDQIINHWIEQLTTDSDQQTILIEKLYEHYEREQIQLLKQLLRNHSKAKQKTTIHRKIFQQLRSLDNQKNLPE